MGRIVLGRGPPRPGVPARPPAGHPRLQRAGRHPRHGDGVARRSATLREVLTRQMLERTTPASTPEHGRYINRVIITEGPAQPPQAGSRHPDPARLPGRTAALHRDGIVHGDLKPSNILLRRTGNAKIIDIGSAIDLRGAAARRLWSPAYAAPEGAGGRRELAASPTCAALATSSSRCSPAGRPSGG